MNLVKKDTTPHKKYFKKETQILFNRVNIYDLFY